jgi:excinuclease ABC subunit C
MAEDFPATIKQKIKSAPKTAGVYSFKNEKGEVIYIGKAINLRRRLNDYLTSPLDQKTRLVLEKTRQVSFIKVSSDFEALLLEASLIKKFQPKYNIKLKDDKSFLYIGITNEEYPKVLAKRKNDLLYPKYLFGPFPSTKIVREILKTLRRIFPFCSQKRNVRPCFWSHLRLCSPCPGEITHLEGENKKAAKLIYFRNIKNLASVLSGRSKKVTRLLSQEMEIASENQQYEKAANFRDQIARLSWLTKPRISVSSYLSNPSFFEEEQNKAVSDLRDTLLPFFSKLTTLERIEGYDISNIAGQESSGSLVVFIGGIENKDDYRRFKIRLSGKPDDPGMLAEVLERRLKHQDWDYPKLIIIDGGKGQISAAINVLEKFNLEIPVIGLAKRLETIIIPQKIVGNLKFEELNLKPDSAALRLLQRIRDEAHHFAKSYHQKLRITSFLKLPS